MTDTKNTPFKIPSNDEIFVTREAEKVKMNEEKKKSKDMKIWEKKTAVTASKLCRIKESDIPQYAKTKQIKYNTDQRYIHNQGTNQRSNEHC